MAVTLKYRGPNPQRNEANPAEGRRRGLLASGLVRVILAAVVCLVVLVSLVGLYYYNHYKGIVDQRLAAGPLFAPVTQIYAAPREVRNGQSLTANEIALDLRRAGYAANSQLGSYELRDPDTIFIKPGPQSFHSTDGATVVTTGGIVQSITAEGGAQLAAYQLEPQLISSLSEDKNRTKRRLVTYNEIPRQMVQAVLAIEDRRFFEHSGINVGRTLKCGLQDLLSNHMACGGSTVTQQLARGFFLSPEKRISRKISEILISFQLEARFSKQQIFEMYANQINLGQRGTFGINGFGEAAQAYFGRDLRQLDLAQEALIAGIIQSPSRLNPYRHPDRAVARRNVVLGAMAETGAITEAQAHAAENEPLHLAPQNVDASEAPYFVDLVHEQLAARISDQDQAHQSLRIYTSLDPELQRVAGEAVELGMQHVDALIAKRPRGNGDSSAPPQVALVALNPHTGQVLALVGGRNYNASQYDHAVAKRPTGSIFKPWVYAAAYNSSLNGTALGDQGPFTAVTQLNDESTTFTYDNGRKTYNPQNKLSGYKGQVTAVYALAHSLNAATVSLGQQVGFENVASLARASGITAAQGTPSVALGSYDATPLDMAGAYTVFANGGVHLKPWLLASVRNTGGDIVTDFTPQAQQVMDPRAAYLTQSLLESVMTFGTGAAARSRGFNYPAAGKTGTSHDVWFAAYSSNLLCVIWIGNDDYTDVKMQGATAAAPIWGEFMKRAQKLPQYSDMKSFTAPSGVQVLRLDKATNLVADASCPDDYSAAFLDGTAPQNTCAAMNESPGNFVNRIFSNDPSPYENPNAPPGTYPGANSGVNPAAARPGNPSAPRPTYPNPNAPRNPYSSPSPTVATPPGQQPNTPQPTDTNPDGTPKKKRGFFGRLFGGGDNKNKQEQQVTPAPK